MARREHAEWATQDIADVGNGDPNKLDPGQGKRSSGWAVEKPLLQTMNWVQNLFGHFIKSNNQVLYINTATELEAGQRVRVNNLSGNVTTLLPADPLDGQWCEIGGQGAYTNTLAVSGNGNNIMLAGDTTCTIDDTSPEGTVYRFYFNTSLDLWKIEQVILGGA